MELTRRPSFAILLAASLPLCPGRANAAVLRMVSNTDIAKALDSQGASHTRSLPILALRFSPDGKKLAVVADWYGPRGDEKSRLLVIGVPDARPEPRLFEIGAGVNEHDDVSADFGWSSSGRAIYAGESIINLDEGSVCHVLGRVQLVADDLGVADDRTPWDWAALASRLRLFNAQCQATGAWEVPGKWAIVDVSPDRGLLSVAKIVGFPNKAEDLIADPLARRIVQRWSGARQPGGQFADRGRAICSGSDAGAADRAPVTCWEADSGKKIGEAPTINGGDPIAPALHVGRVVASDYRRRKTPFSYEYTEIFKRRVLWDFRAGREVVSWRPRFQTWDFQLDPDPSKPSKHVDEPFRFALSPDGEYVAEGGNGRVYLYKVEP